MSTTQSSRPRRTLDMGAPVAPGYAGFVPNLKYQFGLSYGTAARQLWGASRPAETRRQQQQQQAALPPLNASLPSGQNVSLPTEDAIGDERFAFPAVPGYTGYIPRSQEHFGKAYSLVTRSAIDDFQHMKEVKINTPARAAQLQARLAYLANKREAGKESNPTQPNRTANSFRRASGTRAPEETSDNAPSSRFISGYTGYVPQLKNHFGHSVKYTLDEAATTASEAGLITPSTDNGPLYRTGGIPCGLDILTVVSSPTLHHAPQQQQQPIPGFTGHIPGSKYLYATTYGHVREVLGPASSATLQRRHGAAVTDQDEAMRVALRRLDITGSSEKHLAERTPITGYMGHIPGYIFTSEHAYGQSSRACLQEFSKEQQTIGAHA